MVRRTTAEQNSDFWFLSKDIAHVVGVAAAESPPILMAHERSAGASAAPASEASSGAQGALPYVLGCCSPALQLRGSESWREGRRWENLHTQPGERWGGQARHHGLSHLTFAGGQFVKLGKLPGRTSLSHLWRYPGIAGVVTSKSPKPAPLTPGLRLPRTPPLTSSVQPKTGRPALRKCDSGNPPGAARRSASNSWGQSRVQSAAP